MSKTVEFISEEGEVFAINNFNSEKEFEFKLLNSLDFQTIKTFFIKKTIIELVKEKSKLSNSSNGVTVIELLNFFKFNEINQYLEELELKKIIQKKKGINSEMYFMYKK